MGLIKMAKDPGIGKKVTAKIISVNRKCTLVIRGVIHLRSVVITMVGCVDFCYRDIFPSLSTFQFGGNLPWWEGNTIQLQCPDSYNLATLESKISERN
jgi:hypothetical protein